MIIETPTTAINNSPTPTGIAIINHAIHINSTSLVMFTVLVTDKLLYKEFSQHAHNVVDRGVLRAMWEELVG